MASTADGIPRVPESVGVTIALALSLCRVDGRIWMILPRVDVTDVGVDCTYLVCGIGFGTMDDYS